MMPSRRDLISFLENEVVPKLTNKNLHLPHIGTHSWYEYGSDIQVAGVTIRNLHEWFKDTHPDLGCPSDVQMRNAIERVLYRAGYSGTYNVWVTEATYNHLLLKKVEKTKRKLEEKKETNQADIDAMGKTFRRAGWTLTMDDDGDVCMTHWSNKKIQYFGGSVAEVFKRTSSALVQGEHLEKNDEEEEGKEAVG